MLPRAVPLVRRPVVVRGLLMHAAHDGVAIDLRDDRRRRYRRHLAVSTDKAVHRMRRIDAQLAVAAVSVGLHQVDETAKDVDVRPPESPAVDVVDAHLGYRPRDGAAPDHHVDLLALPGG